jgi:hypothetical protein
MKNEEWKKTKFGPWTVDLLRVARVGKRSDLHSETTEGWRITPAKGWPAFGRNYGLRITDYGLKNVENAHEPWRLDLLWLIKKAEAMKDALPLAFIAGEGQGEGRRMKKGRRRSSALEQLTYCV